MESARLTPRVNELIKQIRAFKPNYSYDRFTLPGKGGYTESDVEYLENTLVETEALRAKPIAGGGANLKNLTPLEIVRIQNAANRTGVQITVVGSRAGVPLAHCLIGITLCQRRLRAEPFTASAVRYQKVLDH